MNKYKEYLKFIPYLKLKKSININAILKIILLIIFSIFEIVMYIKTGGIPDDKPVDALLGIMSLGLYLLLKEAFYLMIRFIIPVLVIVILLLIIIIVRRSIKIDNLNNAFIELYGKENLYNNDYLEQQLKAYKNK